MNSMTNPRPVMVTQFNLASKCACSLVSDMVDRKEGKGNVHPIEKEPNVPVFSREIYAKGQGQKPVGLSACDMSGTYGRCNAYE